MNNNCNKINILAPNIKNGGGKELLEYLLEYLNTNYSNIKVIVYLDSSLSHIISSNNRKVVYLSSVKEKIKLFTKSLDNSLYFGNLPPLVKTKNSIVYFHNLYLLMPFNILKKSSIKFVFKFMLQQLYINIFIKNVDTVAVQNKNIQSKFINKYKHGKVELLPFFRLCDKDIKSDKIYDFCYVSLAHSHKNHDRLFDAMQILSDKNINTSLALTIEKEHDDLIKKIASINNKGVVKITNLGVLKKEEVCKLYSQSKCLVFPSTQETFGLALIESVNMGLDIIASNLDYAYQSVNPSLTFDPGSSKDIAEKLKTYLLKSANKSDIIISNEIDKLIQILIKGSN
jgi:glycosyltransferase involved in cell wall biosynthesis